MRGDASKSNASIRVGVVEDEKIISLEITRTLEHMGYRIAGLATTGPEAIALAETERPDVILMDILLRSEMDGIEAAQRITARQSVPIIYLTANTDEDTIQRAKMSGPYGYLVKPINYRELHTTLQMALYKHRAEEQIRASESRYRTLFEHSNDGLLIFDGGGSIVDSNVKASAMLGYGREAFRQMTMAQLHGGPESQAWTRALESLRGSGMMRYETTLMGMGGQAVEVEISGSYLDEGRRLAMAMARDLSERRRSERIIQNISEEIAEYTGQAFFSALVRYLAEALDVDIAFVAEYRDAKPNTVKTLALCDGSEIMSSQAFALENTPCKKVLEEEFYFCPEGVAECYPLAPLVQQLGVESYAGIVLYTPERQPIGYLVVMDRAPLRQLSLTRSTLQLFSVRAAAELIRLRQEEALKISEERYRLLFNNGMDAVFVYGLDEGDQPTTLWEVNDVACALLEYTREELARLKPQELIAAASADTGAFARDGFFEGRLQSKSGRLIPFEISVHRFPIRGEVTVLAVARDLSQRKGVEAALAKERDLIAKIIQHSPVNIFLKDPQGRYMKVNPAFVRFAGQDRAEDVLGRTVRDLFPKEFAQSVENADGEILATGRPLVNREERLVDGQGKERWLLVTKVPFFGEAGEMLGVVGISQDITERVASEREMRRAMLAAEAANRAKSEFLANMSHELRTPMNGIIGLTELAIEGTQDAEIRRYLSMVAQSADSLLTLLNDILDFAKIESGKVSLDQAPFDVRFLIDEVQALHGATAQKKGLILRSEWDEGLPNVLVGDVGRLRQVLNNLVGNAVKFTEQGEIVVAVRPVNSGQEGVDDIPQLPLYTYVHFEVRDTGIGIPEEQLEAIFTSFTQADGSLTRSYGGTGLGLTISRQLIEMMGGEIWVESRPGEGSRFRFYLPFKPAAQEEVAAAVPVKGRREPNDQEEESLRLQGRRILVVEDEPVSREVVVRFLSKWGGRVATASHGQEALDQLASPAFDLVIMDVQMPVLDGLEATRRIRGGEVAGLDPQIPVIALTAHARESDRRLCLDAGMNDYVVKPIDSRLLWQVIEGQLRGIPAVSSIDETAEPGSVELIDEKAVLHRLAGDRELFMKTMQIFQEQMPERMAALEGAIAKKDGEEVVRLAHSLKSASANIGAFGLHDRAEALEKIATGRSWKKVQKAHRSMSDQYQQVMTILPRFLTRKGSSVEEPLCQH